jgi:hypothetical protein
MREIPYRDEADIADIRVFDEKNRPVQHNQNTHTNPDYTPDGKRKSSAYKTPAATARISGWTIHKDHADCYLIGVISAHPRQHEFHRERQQTSSLRSIDFEKRIAITQNTVYTLD